LPELWGFVYSEAQEAKNLQSPLLQTAKLSPTRNVSIARTTAG
jgi:hypothetical protein